MKKIIYIFTLFAVCGLWANNLIKDGGFELKKGASGISNAWKYYEFHGAETVIKLEELTKKAARGKKSAIVKRLSGGSLGGIFQEKISVKEETTYKITAKALTGTDTAAFVKVEFFNDANVLLGEITSKDQVFAQWGNLGFSFKTLSGTTTIKVILAMRGRTYAAFDDVILTVDNKTKDQDWAGFAARCLPVETVKAWSNRAVFSTFEDSPAALTFQFKGKYATLVNPALVLDLPAELDMIEAT